MIAKDNGSVSKDSNETRLIKNATIAATQRATRAKRLEQICRVYDLKVVTNKLNARQREALKMVFIESKWLRNAALSHPTGALNYTLGSTVTVLNKDRVLEKRSFKFLGSQLKQSTLKQVHNDIKGLAAAKVKGRKIGKLGFSSEVSSLELKQYGKTYRFKPASPSLVKIQNIPGWLKVRGTQQFTSDNEFANAKLVNRPDGYHLLVTTYVSKTSPTAMRSNIYQPGTRVGLDMGIKTHITLSDGTEVDALFGETARLKRLQRKLSKQIKGSNNYVRTKKLIRREHQKLTQQRDDCANKIVHELLLNEKVFIQDENISSWKKRNGYVSGGKRVHGSILGRVKTKLMNHERVIVLPRHVATTATCVCGHKTKHSVDKRVFICGACGYSAPRDTHAAENMIRLGSLTIPVEHRELTRVETDINCEAGMNFTFLPTNQRSRKHEASRLF